jgi:hypothetical protein
MSRSRPFDLTIEEKRAGIEAFDKAHKKAAAPQTATVPKETDMPPKKRIFTAEEKVRGAMACIIAMFGEVFEESDKDLLMATAERLSAMFDYTDAIETDATTKAIILTAQFQQITALAQHIELIEAAAGSHKKLTLEELCG